MRTLTKFELERINIIKLYQLSNNIHREVKQKEKKLALPIDHEDLYGELMKLDLFHIAIASEIDRRTNKVTTKIGSINITLN